MSEVGCADFTDVINYHIGWLVRRSFFEMEIWEAGIRLVIVEAASDPESNFPPMALFSFL
jgi:hypothetical protein